MAQRSSFTLAQKTLRLDACQILKLKGEHNALRDEENLINISGTLKNDTDKPLLDAIPLGKVCLSTLDVHAKPAKF